jgi:hypothetical protein
MCGLSSLCLRMSSSLRLGLSLLSLSLSLSLSMLSLCMLIVHWSGILLCMNLWWLRCMWDLLWLTWLLLLLLLLLLHVASVRVRVVERRGRHRAWGCIDTKGRSRSRIGEKWVRERFRCRDTLRWIKFEKTFEKVDGFCE